MSEPRCDALIADNTDPAALTEEWEELARELERELAEANRLMGLMAARTVRAEKGET